MPRLCSICQLNLAPVRKRLCDECRALCSRCRERPRMARHHYCNACKAAQTRESRTIHPPSARQRALSYAAVYIQRGKLQRGHCQAQGCGSEVTFPFHPDTSKPLEVMWFCKRHLRMARKAADEEDSC